MLLFKNLPENLILQRQYPAKSFLLLAALEYFHLFVLLFQGAPAYSALVVFVASRPPRVTLSPKFYEFFLLDLRLIKIDYKICQDHIFVFCSF